MVTRIEKSSKLRNGTEYLLLWRLAKAVGKVTVDRAVKGNIAALAKIEKFAWEEGRKKPAVVKWVNKQLRKRARGKR